MTKLQNIMNAKYFTLIIGFSLIIAENYFFLWNKRFLIHPSYLFFNTLFLFFFSLIFFSLILYLIDKVSNHKKEEFLFIIILSFIIVKLIQTNLFYSDATTLSIIFEKLFSYFINNTLSILFLKKITPYFLVFLMIYFLKNKIIFIQRFIFSFSIIFLLIMIYSISLRYLNYDKVEINTFNISSEKKVVWIILDEFDPSLAFDDKNKLVNFDLFKEKSLVLSNSYSPSSHTLESIPSIFMSRDVKEIKYLDNKIYLKDNLQNKEINFNFSNSFLSDLNQNNLNFNLYSEVLPYCFILGLEKNCEENKNKFSNYFDGLLSSFTPLAYIDRFNEKLRKFEKYDLIKIQKFNEKYKIDQNFILSEKLKFNIESLEKELKSDNNLTFIHLFLPKENVEASKSVKKFYNSNSNKDYENYLMMLNYTDLIIKGINKLIDKYNHKDIMLIVSSDHWYRKLSEDIKPSLFILKIFKDDNKIVNNKKIMNIFIPNLILKYLNNEIKNHSEINNYINSLDDINMSLIKNNLNINENFDNF